MLKMNFQIQYRPRVIFGRNREKGRVAKLFENYYVLSRGAKRKLIIKMPDS